MASRDIQEQPEERPLLRSLSEASISRIWFGCSVGALVVSWCVFDSWNHETVSGISKVGIIKGTRRNPFTGERVPDVEQFQYILMLAFIQFAFLGVVFCALFAASVFATGSSFCEQLWPITADRHWQRWPAMVGTHMCGSFVVQTLMMPSQMMSLGLFAATRAIEIPVAAGARAKAFGSSYGGHNPYAVATMFGAAWLMFFSYTEIADCLCVWSGFGVALSGLPLYVVYSLLLTLPACNMVLQESAMTQLQLHPFLVQGIQNIVAAVLFIPILVGAHCIGQEDMWQAIQMITGHREVYMSVLWLCVQTTIVSAITAGMISMLDSFWAVSAHSLRVVFWWVRQLPQFYLTSGVLLSVAKPHASLWSFVMILGLCLGCGAVCMDRKHSERIIEDKHARNGLSEHCFIPKGLGMGRYV